MVCHRFNKQGRPEKAVLREAELVPGSAAAPEQHPADADAGEQHGAVFDRREVIESVLEHSCELREPAIESANDGKEHDGSSEVTASAEWIPLRMSNPATQRSTVRLVLKNAGRGRTNLIKHHESKAAAISRNDFPGATDGTVPAASNWLRQSRVTTNAASGLSVIATIRTCRRYSGPRLLSKVNSPGGKSTTSPSLR